MRTDLIQQLTDLEIIVRDIDPILPVAAAGVLVIVFILLALFIKRGSKQKRLLGEAEHTEKLRRESEAQLEAALNAIPYSQDPAEAARAVTSVFGERYHVRVLAVYSGKRNYGSLPNILKQSATVIGPLTRPILASSINAAYLAAHNWAQFVPRGDLIAASGPDSSASHGDPVNPAHPESSEGPRRSEDGSEATTRQVAATSPLDSGPLGLLPWHGLFGWTGLLVIESRDPVDFENLAIVLQNQPQLTSRLAVALELDRAIASAISAVDQSARLVGFLQSAVDGIRTQPALTESLKQVAGLMASDSAAFWAEDAKIGMLRMLAAHGLNPEGFLPIPTGQGLSGFVAQSGEPLAVDDAPADPKCLFPNEARESGIISYLGVPVVSEGQVEGVLEVHTRQPHQWGPASISALRSAALALTAINMATTRGPEARAPSSKDRSALGAQSAYLTISQTFESLGSPAEVIEATVEVLGHALGVSRVIAIEKGGQPGFLNGAVIKHEYHDPQVPSTVGAMMPEEFAARLFQAEGTEGPIVVNDSAVESPMPQDTVTRLHICSEMLVPLKADQDVVAVIDIQQCGQPRQWSRDEIEFADKLAHQASVSITHLAGWDKANRSDFIVNAGRELEVSLQSVLACAELLGRGHYGPLTPEQLEAINEICAGARRMKNDVDWLIEYGSTRPRTMESGAERLTE